MVMGQRKHLKRLAAPKHWMLSKLGGIWAPRPSAGAHKMRECLPLVLILRNRLKLALTRREVLMIVMRRFVKVDGKVRTDMNYPAGFMDVVSIEKAGKVFRLLYDTKGHFVLHKINDVESKFKLCRVTKVAKGAKAYVGVNAKGAARAASIPYLRTHDTRTIRFADPAIKVNDVVKVDIATGKVVGHLKFEVGQLATITSGHNIGRTGLISAIDLHPGAFDIVHIKDTTGASFATRYVTRTCIDTPDRFVVCGQEMCLMFLDDESINPARFEALSAAEDHLSFTDIPDLLNNTLYTPHSYITTANVMNQRLVPQHLSLL